MTLAENELTVPRRLESWVAEYEAKVGAIPEAIADFEAAGEALKVASCIRGVYGEQSLDVGHVYPHQMLRSVRVSAWRRFVAELKLDTYMSAADRNRFERMMADPLPFDIESIRAVFGDHIANPRLAVLRGMAEVFADLDPAFKSHEKMKIGVKGLPKRVIISGLNSYGGGWGWDKIRDIINALASYQQRPLVNGVDMAALREDGDALRDGREVLDPYESAHVHRRRAERGEPPNMVLVAGRGVWLKRFQNGNGHLFFGPEALRDINLALAEFYGDVLPDCYDGDEARPARRASTEVAKDLQFYPTPEAVIDRLLSDCQLEGKRVLEPSCGDGRIMDALRKAGAVAFGVEVNPSRAAHARAKGHVCSTANFLEVHPDLGGRCDFDIVLMWCNFDLVLMNPPFYGKHYAEHVRHALRFLKPRGKLRAILPATARYDHGLLDDLNPRWEDLPVGAFAESGTNICTTIATIYAPKEGATQ